MGIIVFNFYHRFDQAIAVCDVDYIKAVWDFTDVSKTCLARGIKPPQHHPRFYKFWKWMLANPSVMFHLLPPLPTSEDQVGRLLHRYLYYGDWNRSKFILSQRPNLSMPCDLVDRIYDLELLSLYKNQSYPFTQQIIHPMEVTQWRLEHGMATMKLNKKRLECVMQDPHRILVWCKLLHWPINQHWIQVWLQTERTYDALLALETVCSYAKREKLKLQISRITDGGPNLEALTS